MACNKCNTADSEQTIFYYRWGNANIGVTGCTEHVQQIFQALNKVQQSKEDIKFDVFELKLIHSSLNALNKLLNLTPGPAEQQLIDKLGAVEFKQ